MAVIACFLASCRALPPPDGGPARTSAERAAATQPVRFDSRQSLLFEFRPRWWWPTVRIAALGYASVNRATGDYAMVCLSPLGVKLFDIGRSNGRLQASSLFQGGGDPQAMSRSIGADLADLLFDLGPPAGVAPVLRKDRLCFRAESDGQTVDYVFAADTGRLLEKTRSAGWRRHTRIAFEEYRDTDGRTYPARAVLHNYRIPYRLTITLQTLTVQSAAP